MAGKFSLKVISPERLVFEGDVEAVYAPGSEGEFGILAGHAPYLAQLKVGKLRILQNEKWLNAAVHGGFSEVDYTSMRVLVEACEFSNEIDVARANQAKQKAEDKLKGGRREEDDFGNAEAALERAMVRLEVAEKNNG